MWSEEEKKDYEKLREFIKAEKDARPTYEQLDNCCSNCMKGETDSVADAIKEDHDARAKYKEFIEKTEIY